MLRKTALLLILLIGITACSDRNKNNSNLVVEAYRLIDKDRTDEAISLLEGELSEDPNNYQYKVVLASAYAHKGGVRVQKFVSLVNQSTNLKQIKQRLKSKDTKKIVELNEIEKASHRISKFALKVADLLILTSVFFEIYIAIPTITDEQVIYLKHAIDLLSSLDPNLKSEDALYRAVLRIILFKHIFNENLIGEFMPPEEKTPQSCKLDLVIVNDAMVEMGKTLIGILDDLTIAHPKKSDSYKELSNDIANKVSDFTVAVSTASFIDEASELFMKQLAIQNGLGKLIRCQ